MKKGALLVERDLVGGEIEQRRIDLDLAEVRVDGGVEREARGQVVLDVRAGVELRPRRSVIGVARLGILELLARDHVRKQLRLSRHLRDRQAFQMPVIGGPAALVAAAEGPLVLLVQPVDEAPELEAPGLDVLAREAQLRVRDAHLGRPPVGRDLRGALPVGIPRGFAIELVAANPRGIDLEPHLVEVVMVRIEDDRQLIRGEGVERSVVPVGGEQLVAPRERRADACPAQRLAHAGAHVEGVVVVEDADLGRERRGRPLARTVLPELGDRRRRGPGGLVQPPIHHDG